jgi:circadian clock protein KaiC
LAELAEERVRTGIPELDEMLGGGLPRGSVILVAGNPGTGKTTFAAAFAYEGARTGEPTVYLSFAESKKKFYKYMKQFGMNFEEAERRGLFEYVEAPTIADIEAMERIIEIFIERLVKLKAKRAVIDSISAVVQVMGRDKARAALHNMVRMFESNNVTALLIEDLPYGVDVVGHGVEEFLVDGVIVFKVLREVGLTRRIMEIRKLRGVTASYYEVPFTIEPGRGLVLLLHERPERVEMDIHGGLNPVPTGVDGLDEALQGGLASGFQVLIVGPPGSGKTILASRIALKWAYEGKRVVYIGFNEPTSQLASRFRLMGLPEDMAVHPVPIDDTNYTMEEPVHVMSVNATAYTLEQLYWRLARIVEQLLPDLIVLDGVSQLISRAPSPSELMN